MATSIKLDPKLKARVDEVARLQRRSAHWIMVEAIRLYVEQEERRGPSDPQRSWASFHDRAQDEISPTQVDDPPPLRPWHEVLVFEADPNRKPDPEREEAWKRFEALAGAGARLGRGRTKEEIDAHIRWLRDDRD